MTSSELIRELDDLEHDIWWVLQHSEDESFQKTADKLNGLNVKHRAVLDKLTKQFPNVSLKPK